MDRVLIFDTTLRDGEQSPGISLDVGEKLEIADQLARLGVDIIEAGFPIASRRRLRGRRGHRQGGTRADHRRLCPHRLQGRRPCVGGGPARGAHRIHVFIATSEIHMRKKLRMTPDQVKAEAAAAVARAKSYTDDVEFSPEDGFRSDPDFMCEVCQIAVDSRRDDAEHPRHRRVRHARGVREADRVRHRPRAGRLRRLHATATTTSAWRSPTRSPAS